MTHTILIQLSGALFAGLCAAFIAVNLGLRLVPEGRSFLAAARKSGKIFAGPGEHGSAPVRTVFALSVGIAVMAAVMAFFRLGVVLEPAVVPYPKAVANHTSAPGPEAPPDIRT